MTEQAGKVDRRRLIKKGLAGLFGVGVVAAVVTHDKASSENTNLNDENLSLSNEAVMLNEILRAMPVEIARCFDVEKLTSDSSKNRHDRYDFPADPKSNRPQSLRGYELPAGVIYGMEDIPIVNIDKKEMGKVYGLSTTYRTEDLVAGKFVLRGKTTEHPNRISFNDVDISRLIPGFVEDHDPLYFTIVDGEKKFIHEEAIDEALGNLTFKRIRGGVPGKDTDMAIEMNNFGWMGITAIAPYKTSA